MARASPSPTLARAKAFISLPSAKATGGREFTLLNHWPLDSFPFRRTPAKHHQKLLEALLPWRSMVEGFRSHTCIPQLFAGSPTWSFHILKLLMLEDRSATPDRLLMLHLLLG